LVLKEGVILQVKWPVQFVREHNQVENEKDFPLQKSCTKIAAAAAAAAVSQPTDATTAAATGKSIDN
jgi:hypothetical protein